MAKKILSVLLCLAMTATLLVGCGNSTEEAQGNEPTVDVEEQSDNAETATAGFTADMDLRAYEGTTLTFVHDQGEYSYEYFYRWMDEFEKLTGITVEVSEVNNADWSTWYEAQFSAGTEPDILFSSIPNTYFDQGKLADLTAYYDGYNVFAGIPWLDCFIDGADTLKNCLSTDKEHYIATAFQTTSTYLYYNKDIMAELGYTEPPTNVTEMLEMMKACKEKTDYIPMSAMNSIDWNIGWMLNEFAHRLFSDSEEIKKLDVIVEDGILSEEEALLGWKTGILNASNPRTVEIFRLVKDISQYLNEDFNAVSWEFENYFNEGNVLFNINGGWYPGQAVSYGADVNYGTVDWPYIDKEYSEYGTDGPVAFKADAGTPNLFVSKRCEDEGRLDAAVMFLQFMTSAEHGAQMYTDDILVGTVIKGVEYPEVISGLGDIVYGDAQKTDAKEIPEPSEEAYDIMRDELVEFLDPSSTLTAEQFCAELVDLIEPTIDEAIEDNTVFDIMSYVDQVQ